MADFILELYAEEIPAGMQARAAEHLEQAFVSALKARGVEPLGVESYVAPQRLALLVDDMPQKTEEVRSEKKGPRVDAPQQAVDGFLRSNSLTDVTALRVQQDSKGDYYVFEAVQPAEDMADILATVISEIILSFPWPKSMRWGAGKLRWVRPLRSILCRLGGHVVEFEVDGLKSGGTSYGHRFLAPQPIEIKHAADYLPLLEKAFVLADPAIRSAMIAEECAHLAAAHGFAVVEDIALVQETAGLVEWPVPLMGTIDTDFMTVPDELLTSVMRTHQKYFSVQDKKTGRLASKFITISNMVTADQGAQIIAGNERVLRARLSDGKFFWDQDVKTKLIDRLPALNKITFHAALGSVGQKAQRISALAHYIAEHLGEDQDQAARAGLLCKTDLVSGVVYEFPELQGIMGGYYAVNDGEGEVVGAAIKDHYRPAGPRDAVPATSIGRIVALADKIDTLAGFWLIDEKPTGSKDPYALRRAALGTIRIILEHDLQLPLGPLLSKAIAAQNVEGAGHQADTVAIDLLSFIIDRLQVYLRDAGLRHDIVAASLLDGADNIVDIVARGQALTDFVMTEDGKNLLAAHNRATGILQKSKSDAAIDVTYLQEQAEKDLYAALQNVGDNGADMQTPEALQKYLVTLSALRAPVDAFFDKVLVNADDAKLKANRLALLHSLIVLMERAGKLSQIVR